MHSKITWQWRIYEELKISEMQALFALRQDVFIVEQNCPYQDIDGKDQQAHHLLAWMDDQLVATLRVFGEYEEYQGMVAIGRVCTCRSIRKEGVGKLLLSRALEYIQEKFPDKVIQLGAQLYLKRFYQAYDFVQVSEIYDEDGIEHILMQRPKLAKILPPVVV